MDSDSYQGSKLSRSIVNSEPKTTADFPKKWVQSAYWTFCSPQGEPPMTATHLFFFTEAVLTQSRDQRNLGNTSMLDKPSSSSLFNSTCSAQGHLGRWGSQRVDTPAVPGREFAATAPYAFNHSLQPERERTENLPYSYILTAHQTCPREGRIQFQEPFSFSGSLILFDLLTSSWSSVTKRRSSSTWVYLPQVWSLLPSCTGINVGHTLQPGTWAAAGSHQSSIWAAASVVVGAELSEAMFFCWVDKLRGLQCPSCIPLLTNYHATLPLMGHPLFAHHGH